MTESARAKALAKDFEGLDPELREVLEPFDDHNQRLIDNVHPAGHLAGHQISLSRTGAQARQHTHSPVPGEGVQVLGIENHLQRFHIVVDVGVGDTGFHHGAHQRQRFAAERSGGVQDH